MEKVTFHGRDDGRSNGRDDGRDDVRDDVRSTKEETFIIICITDVCGFHIRDVRSFRIPV